MQEVLLMDRSLQNVNHKKLNVNIANKLKLYKNQYYTIPLCLYSYLREGYMYIYILYTYII